MLQGENSAGGTVVYAQVGARIDDPTSTSEDGSLRLAASIAGLLTNYAYMGANAAATATPGAIGLPLGQLSFPATQNASSDANTLDDYQEAPWSPVLTSSVGSITAQTSAGTYTKIGNRLICDFTCTITTVGTGSGNLTITGLPETSGASSMGYARETVLTGLGYSVSLLSGSTTLSLFRYDNGAASISNTTSYTGSISYRV
jgi:hypothetical protein